MGTDEERPRKSWRELDRQRDKSGHRPEDRTSGRKSPAQESQGYRAYKTQLNKLFDGGGLPEALKERLQESGIGNESKQRKAALQEICQAKTPKSVMGALKTYRESFGFPEDEEVLAKLLDLDQEPDIIRETLHALDMLHEAGGLKRASSLKGRIKTAQMTTDDDEVFALAKALLGNCKSSHCLDLILLLKNDTAALQFTEKSFAMDC
ncbi:MAG: hypothetical protein R3C68_18270 [Myxococcota bacterium]